MEPYTGKTDVKIEKNKIQHIEKWAYNSELEISSRLDLIFTKSDLEVENLCS